MALLLAMVQHQFNGKCFVLWLVSNFKCFAATAMLEVNCIDSELLLTMDGLNGLGVDNGMGQWQPSCSFAAFLGEKIEQWQLG